MAAVPYSSEILCMHKISPSTDVHGCTTVEDGSNGLAVPIILRFCSTLPDAFALLLKKLCKIFFKILHKKDLSAYIFLMKLPCPICCIGSSRNISENLSKLLIKNHSEYLTSCRKYTILCA